MKKLLSILSIALLAFTGLQAQDVTTVEVTNPSLGDNLDLEAVASIFADAEDLADFEKQLNDPELRISNLDLNEDGYVDYLRVVETGLDRARLVTIQAVLAKDVYQDVATIDVEQDDRGQTRVQVVGDVYMYGNDYIIEPVYRYRPRIFAYMWAPRANFWCSTFTWGFYPNYWSYWSPFSYGAYFSHVRPFAHHHAFYYRPYRYSTACHALNQRHRRNDYGRNHPGRSFASNHRSANNHRELRAQRNESVRPSGYVATNRGATSANVTRTSNGATKPSTTASTRTLQRSTQSKPSATTRTTQRSVQSKPAARTQSRATNASTTRRVEQKPRATAPASTRQATKPQQKPRVDTGSRTSSRERQVRTRSTTQTLPSTSTQSSRQRSSATQRSTPSRSSSSTQSSRSRQRSSTQSPSSSPSRSSSVRSSSSSRSSAPRSSTSRSSRSSSSKGSSPSRTSPTRRK